MNLWSNMKLWLYEADLRVRFMMRDPDPDSSRRLIRRIDACDRLRAKRKA